MGKGKDGVPTGWLDYRPLGRRIPGTRFIVFKVPLKKSFEWRLPPDECFSPRDLLNQMRQQQEELGLIIDLTFTTRYYDPREFPATIQYCKIFTAGHAVPNKKTVSAFKNAVGKFLMENQHNDKLIGVHCTHGLNRTGYLVCRYLIDVEGMDPDWAIELFNRSRGHPIERENYIEDLIGRSGQRNHPAISGHGWFNGHVGPDHHSGAQVVDYRPQKLQQFPEKAPRNHPAISGHGWFNGHVGPDHHSGALVIDYHHQKLQQFPEKAPRRRRQNTNLITCYDNSQSVWDQKWRSVFSQSRDHPIRPNHEPMQNSPYQEQLPAYGPVFPSHNPQFQRHPGRQVCWTVHRELLKQ